MKYQYFNNYLDQNMLLVTEMDVHPSNLFAPKDVKTMLLKKIEDAPVIYRTRFWGRYDQRDPRRNITWSGNVLETVEWSTEPLDGLKPEDVFEEDRFFLEYRLEDDLNLVFKNAARAGVQLTKTGFMFFREFFDYAHEYYPCVVTQDEDEASRINSEIINARSNVRDNSHIGYLNMESELTAANLAAVFGFVEPKIKINIKTVTVIDVNNGSRARLEVLREEDKIKITTQSGAARLTKILLVECLKAVGFDYEETLMKFRTTLNSQFRVSSTVTIPQTRDWRLIRQDNDNEFTAVIASVKEKCGEIEPETAWNNAGHLCEIAEAIGARDKAHLEDVIINQVFEVNYEF